MENSIWCASGTELTILASIISIYIGELYNASDLNTIANFVEAIGENLEILAAQKNRCENYNNTQNNN